MEHKQLAKDQEGIRPLSMINKGLFYCLCPVCNEQHTQQAQNITDKNDWFYYSTEPCQNCQNKS